MQQITFNNSTAGYVESFLNGQIGQVITVNTLNTNTTIKNRSAANVDYIFTGTGADVILQPGVLYTFEKFADSWYMK